MITLVGAMTGSKLYEMVLKALQDEYAESGVNITPVKKLTGRETGGIIEMKTPQKLWGVFPLRPIRERYILELGSVHPTPDKGDGQEYLDVSYDLKLFHNRDRHGSIMFKHNK
ncbi:MAG TPA: hypothetical protein VLI92_01210 [Candidatus Saccharimonadales bacterium]|nr:hypothetical protein [Candidatus Saccharimonadales bacterium]